MARAVALGEISQEDCVRIARAFEEARGPDGFVSSAEGKRCLQTTGLSDHRLQRVWHLSDLDRDGRLSLCEFACAIHLAGQAKRGRELPVEVTRADQEAVAHKVEAMLNTGGAYASADGVVSSLSHQPAMPSAGGRGVPRGRDRSPRSLPNLGGMGGLSRLGESAPPQLPSESEVALGQLASVFDTVARLDASGDLRRLSREVLDERRELERQLIRRRDLERQLQECHGHMERLREEHRRAGIEAAAAKRQIGHLQDELVFVERESKDAEEDLAVLRTAGDLAPSSSADAAGRRGPAPYTSAEEERRDVLSKVRAEREILQRDHYSIEECRLKLDEVLKHKLDAQLLQQTLLEKQRQAEHDRGLMLTAIEAERGKLSAMRAERIKMWEERSTLEREMTDVVQERWLAAHQPLGQGRAVGAVAAAPASHSAGGMPSGARAIGHPATAGGVQRPPAQSSRVRGVRQNEPPPMVVGGSDAQPGVPEALGAAGPPEVLDPFGIDGGLSGDGLGTLIGAAVPFGSAPGVGGVNNGIGVGGFEPPPAGRPLFTPSGGGYGHAAPGGGGFGHARPLGVEGDGLGRAAPAQRRKADSRGVRNDDAMDLSGELGGGTFGGRGGWDQSFAGGPSGGCGLGLTPVAAGRT